MIGIVLTVLGLLPFYLIGTMQQQHQQQYHQQQNYDDSTTKFTAVVVGGGGGVAVNKTQPNHRVNDNKNKNIVKIPYIKYKPNTFEDIKARMDYAAQHGSADDPNNINNTVGQYLLDFGIIGFPKCGTTTMMRWLNMNTSTGTAGDLRVINHEIMALQKSHPAKIIHHVLKAIPEGSIRRGYKSPNDIEDGRARNKLRVHYPSTKLIVGLRHPVLWYESFYNHRIQNGYTMPNLTNTNIIQNNEDVLKNTCPGILNGVCFTRARFHTSLVKWGKTSLLSSSPSSISSNNTIIINNNNHNEIPHHDDDADEWKYFTKKEQRSMRKDKIIISSPNPIFVYDVNQLQIQQVLVPDNNTNTNEYTLFVESLQEFLNVTKDIKRMSNMIKESPGKTNLNTTEQARRNSLKMDICLDDYSTIRQWLLRTGTDIHGWISNHFIIPAMQQQQQHRNDNVNNNGSSGSYGHNRNVYVGGGSSTQFGKYLDLYRTDPCLERNDKNNY